MRVFVSKSAVLACCLGLLSLSGCKSWMGYPMQYPARIQPPGTGTYNVPSNYYNQTGGSVSQVYPGTPVNASVMTAAGVPGYSTGVAPATYTTPAGSMGGVTTASTQPGFGQPPMGVTNMGAAPGTGGVDPRAQSNLNWSN